MTGPIETRRAREYLLYIHRERKLPLMETGTALTARLQLVTLMRLLVQHLSHPVGEAQDKYQNDCHDQDDPGDLPT